MKQDISATDDPQRSKVYRTSETLDYVTSSVATKNIMSKNTGSVTVVACDVDAKVGEKISPFDTFVQLLDGSAEVTIDHRTHQMTAGQCIIIPAHFRNTIKPTTRFKMLLTVIKSGYEDAV